MGPETTWMAIKNMGWLKKITMTTFFVTLSRLFIGMTLVNPG